MTKEELSKNIYANVAKIEKIKQGMKIQADAIQKLRDEVIKWYEQIENLKKINVLQQKKD